MRPTKKYESIVAKPWVYHSLFWLCYYVFAALITFSIHHIYSVRFYAELFTLLPPDMLLVYVNGYVLIPAFLLKRHYPVYFLTVGIAMFATSAINIGLHHLYTTTGSTFFASDSTFTVPNMGGQLLNSIYLLGLTTGLKFYKDWIDQRQQLQEKERRQVELELDFLKAQVHPHFFFNTLNNLYSLTLQKSDLAPEVVLMLSDLMSYMLYESGAADVPIEKEIANLQNYMVLERLRFGNRLALSFEPDIPAGASIRIPPLILLTFVENSFKHGIGQTLGEGRIDIALGTVDNQLIFRIANSIGQAHTSPVSGPPSPRLASSSTNGLGLRNVIRRLDLLYGAHYQLDKTETGNQYRVTLKIPIR